MKQETPNKSNLGANAILGVSIAVAKVAAKYLEIPLYRYIGGINAKRLPTPMINMLSGGKLANNKMSIQEVMIMPIGNITFEEKLRRGTEVYHTLKKLLSERKSSIAVGDDGAFLPDLESEEEAIEMVLESIKKAGYKVREEFVLVLDIAATKMYEEAKRIGKEGYYFWKKEELKSKEQMIEYLEELVKKYPIVSLEDALSEDDWDLWEELTQKIGKNTMLVGDDLFVTNKMRLKRGIKNKVANSILIKPNQIGTLTETLDTIRMAKEYGYKTVISHRKGETEDTTIADIAVGVNSGYIKAGAPSRMERVAKYNRLLQIENEIYNFECM